MKFNILFSEPKKAVPLKVPAEFHFFQHQMIRNDI